MDSDTLLLLSAVGALLTAVFTGYPIIRHEMERPRPRWRFSRAPLAEKDYEDPRACVLVTATNVGDGTAYGVKIGGWKTTTVNSANDRSSTHSLGTGESVKVFVHIPVEPDWKRDPYGGSMGFTPTDQQLGDAGVTLSWNHPPHRWWERRKRRRVRAIDLD
ncbi:hypothetical protein [Microbacterium maritypicum]